MLMKKQVIEQCEKFDIFQTSQDKEELVINRDY